MEKLYNKLYLLFCSELSELNSGNMFNYDRIQEMMDIINIIDYIQYGNLSRKEIIKLLKHYESI